MGGTKVNEEASLRKATVMAIHAWPGPRSGGDRRAAPGWPS